MRARPPDELLDAAARSAAPDIVGRSLQRLSEERPDALVRLAGAGGPTDAGRSFVAVVAASNALGRLCLADPDALGVLEALDVPVGTGQAPDVGALARSKRLELLRIAARDLMGLDGLEVVGRSLADMADAVLGRALDLSRGAGGAPGHAPDGEPGGEPGQPTEGFGVIGMGKLGARELNYASDVDVMFVSSEPSRGEDIARSVLRIAGAAFRVDADLRPEGRSGPLSRSLSSYRAYWERWAATWEFQALLKARPVAGDDALGAAFAEAAAGQVWGRTISSDELAEVRAMKARAESEASRRPGGGRELKRAPGGIRDVEFAVQLLQLVHGHHDPDIRVPSTLGALERLGAAGYVEEGDARVLADAYRFLRLVEHRVQLVEEEQTHSLPADPAAFERLARVLGYEDDATRRAPAAFDEAVRRCQATVRTIHERLFFRPLLESFAALPAAEGAGLSAAAVDRRLAAFGFDAARTRAAVSELAGGLKRSSRLMEQLLPLLLDWLSLAPDPDLGLLGLRNLVVHGHHRSLIVSTFRESPEAARRLCLLLGSSRTLAEAIERNPELIVRIDDDAALAPVARATLVTEVTERVRRTPDDAGRRRQLVRARQDQLVGIAARDLLDIDEVEATGAALATVAEALLEASLAAVGGTEPGFCVIGLGRFGGAELSYASDLDVLFVFEDDRAREAGEEDLADRLLHFVHGPSPAERVALLDLGLRPEGGHGRLARDLAGYAGYFAHWAETWERQALTRARVVAGDTELGARFLDLVGRFVWEQPLTEAEESDIRRMKARIERERIPAREDPQFHLKLGKGSLSDVEWTVQLLQLRHRVPCPGTMAALDELERGEFLDQADARALRDAYRFCERTRNRWHLVGALPGGTTPGDALPTEGIELSRLARSLATTPSSLRDDYRRVTRRARRVVERLFYAMGGA